MATTTTCVDNQGQVPLAAKMASRLEGVDVVKFAAIVAIVALHTRPFSHKYVEHADLWKWLGVLIDQTARFAVPFFFVVSGYFWGTKLRSGASVTSASVPMAKRLAALLAVWSVVYLLPYDLTSIAQYGLLGPVKLSYLKLIDLLHHPFVLVMQSTKVHLWFLIGLLYSLGIASLLVARKQYKTLVVVSLALYLIGVLGKAYSATPVGLHFGFDTRNGPFCGTISFVSGYFLSSLAPRREWLRKGLALFGIGWALHFGEIFFLWKLFHAEVRQDYVFGTYFMGLGAAVAALSNHEILKVSPLGRLGRYALGMYAIHFVFVDLFLPMGELGYSPLWDVAYMMLVLMSASVSVLLLSKSSTIRRFVA